MPTREQNPIYKPRPKMPVGTIAGDEALAPMKGGVLHKLFDDGEGGWVLACNQKKKGRYEYMGFIVAISCPRCKARAYGGAKRNDSAA